MSEQTTTPADAAHEHYAWGASSAKQWRWCKGSIALTQHLIDTGEIEADTSTVYADEGSEAHDYADNLLKGLIKEDDIPDKFWEHLEGYVLLALSIEERAKAIDPTAQIMREQYIPLFYAPTEKGTLDHAVVTPAYDGKAPVVEILDLKYGAGVEVDAFENDQEIIYAMSLITKLEQEGLMFFPDETVVFMRIWQPRHWSFNGGAKEWSCTYSELKDYAIDIEADYQASKAASKDDLRDSKEACQFCDAKLLCTHAKENMFRDVPVEISPFTEGITEVSNDVADYTITDAVRVAVFQNRTKIVSLMEAINKDTATRMEAGEEFEGLKLCEGNPGNRAWVDKRQAETLLKKIPAAARYKPRTLISPTQAAKIFKGMDTSTKFDNRFDKLVHRPEGKKVVALASDERPAIATKEVFADTAAPDLSDML